MGTLGPDPPQGRRYNPRVGELESLTWGDVDERRGRWRVRSSVSKTRAARWVSPPAVLFAAVIELCPRDDRVPDRPVFGGFTADRFRTALTRACTGAGIASFSPHDLRHRRISLLHAQGFSWARIGEAVGHSDLMTTARTYTHVLSDEAELDYEALIAVTSRT
jgi:integrase